MSRKNLFIKPYHFKYEKNVSLKNGTIIHIRPIRSDDMPILSIFFETLSEESVFFRFGLRRINMPLDHLARLCRVDYDRDFSFLAVVPGKQEIIIGEVRLNRLSDFETGELSFVIADRWQGKGVGTQLMDFCMVVAKEIGLTTVLMEVMRSNVRMKQFGYKYDFQRLSCNKEDDTETLELKIGSRGEFSHPIHPIREYSRVKRQNNQNLEGACGQQPTYCSI